MTDTRSGDIKCCGDISVEGGLFHRFSIVALYYFYRLKNFPRMTTDFGNRLLTFVGQVAHSAPKKQNGQQGERYADENNEAQL